MLCNMYINIGKDLQEGGAVIAYFVQFSELCCCNTGGSKIDGDQRQGAGCMMI